MTDLDATLRPLNQLSKAAWQVKRDLKDLVKAAEQLGTTLGRSALVSDMDKLGRRASEAKGKLKVVSNEANDLRQALGKLHTTGIDRLVSDAKAAKHAIGSITAEANDVKTAVAQIGNGGFSKLESDARSAQAAIDNIGRAANQASENISKIHASLKSTGSVPAAGKTGIVPGRIGSGFKLAAEGALNQVGVPIPFGMPPAYVAGAVVAQGAVLAGAAIQASASDEKHSDQLRILGDYDAEQQKRVNKSMREVGARRGIGTQGAMEAYGSLLSRNMRSNDALAVFENVITYATATGADIDATADTTSALAKHMGVSADDIPRAHDAMVLGGKNRSFKPKNMSATFPSMLAAMGGAKDTGLRGVRLTIAAAQSIANVSNTPEQAAERFESMINYFSSTEGRDRFKEAGIDSESIMKEAVDKGESPVLALLDVINRKIGSDPKQLEKYVPQDEARAGISAVLSDINGVKAAVAEMENADGAVAKDYDVAVDNVSSATDRLTSNVAANIKNIADPALPYLTAAMTALSDLMEAKQTAIRAAEPDEDANLSIKELEDRIAKREEAMSAIPSWMPDPYDIEGKIQEQIDKDKNAIRKQRGEAPISEDEPVTVKSALAIELRPVRDIGATPGTGEAPIPAVRPDDSYGPNLGRSSGRGYIPVPIKKPLALLKSDSGQAAQESMAVYNQNLKEGGAEAEAEAMGIADRIKALLGFSVSPTISPVLVPPSPAGEPSGPGVGIGKQSSLGTTGGVTVTQNIFSPNSRQAAMRAQREQNRQVRLAQARSYGDVGGRLA